MTLLDRQREYTTWLEKGFSELDLKGLPLVSASAIAGNASQENLVRPVTTGPKDHGSDGVLQWRLDRLDGPRGLKGWSESLGLDWQTLKTQAAFTLWELGNDPRYAVLLKDLHDGKKKIETLTANFCWIYERPNKAHAHLDKRISHARSIYLILAKERKIPLPNKIGAGAAVVVGTAATANAASGGDLLWTVAGGIAALAAAVAGPIVSQWGKAATKAPSEALAPVAEKIDHLATLEARPVPGGPTAELDAAVSRRKAIEVELAAALAIEADERCKLVARLDALRAAIASSENAALAAAPEDVAEAQPS